MESEKKVGKYTVWYGMVWYDTVRKGKGKGKILMYSVL